MDIQIEEWVRDDEGTIIKVYRIDEEDVGDKLIGKDLYHRVWSCNVKNHSFDIIDLIEEGDYVNGHKVLNIVYGEDDNNIYLELEGKYSAYIGNEDIKTIVTKEDFQFDTHIVGDM